MFSLTNKDKLPSTGAKQLTTKAERQTDKDREEEREREKKDISLYNYRYDTMSNRFVLKSV